MLAIELTFLTGRYIATAYNDRRESEWPPHPARLFSALVATHFAAELTSAEATGERAALEWLEQQGPPSIRASEATPRQVVTVFVPVNDTALTNVDQEAEELDEARAALVGVPTGGAKSMRKREASVKKAEAALKKAIARDTAVPSRSGNSDFGRRQLPEFRGRQPRTFPSMTPDDPAVTYLWLEADPTPETRVALAALLRRVVRVGHSSSLAALRLVLVENAADSNWRPDPHGPIRFRTVERGQLAALERAFERHRELEPRVMPAVSHGYSQTTARKAESAPESTFSEDWLVLRRVGGPLLPMTATAGVARAARRTLMSFADEPIPEMLSGHAPAGEISQRVHMAIVPLPFVAHQHASGAILGIALVFPRGTAADDRRAVYRAVNRWEQQHRLEDEDTPSVALALGAAGVLMLERVEWGPVQATLRPAVWRGPSRVWHSATPVALDRNPGDLRSREPRILARSTDEAVEVICRACERIGLPRPRYVEILPAAPLAGSAKARSYPSYPDTGARTQRVLTHVRIEFDRPVKGPILLGAGRYLGLGLLRPEPAQ
jgi:CRISPR-associated protein Csb2